MLRSQSDNGSTMLIKWILIPIVWLTLGAVPAALDRCQGQAVIRPVTLRPGQFMLLAVNEGNTAAGHTASTAENGDATEADTDERIEADGQSAKPGTTPLKPFTPSEQIPAEQAVDFPVDI